MSCRSSITAEIQSTLPVAIEEAAAAAVEPSTPYQLSEDHDNDRIHGLNTSASIKERLQIYISTHLAKELLACVVLGVFFFLIGYAIATKPNQRPIPYQYLDGNGDYVRNLSNNEELESSTFNTLLLLLVCVILCPLLQLTLGNFFGLVGDVHNSLCVYWLALPVNELATWTIKLYVGYLRPNFYSQCQPSNDYQYCTAADENSDSIDGWNLRMSFPSGHASWAFCALTLLSLYLERCFGLSSIQYYTAISPPQDNSNTNTNTSTTTFTTTKTCLVLKHRQNPFVYRLRSLLCLAPIVLAIFIAASRVVDNKHFPADIIAGSLLGYAVARFFHQLWFTDPKVSLQ